MADKIGHVLRAFAQRRQAQRHDVEAEEQVFAKQALLDRDAQVLVGGGDDADIALDRRAAADGRVLALLQYAQQAGLRLHRHVADFVEEQRAALGLLEAAGRALVGAGEGALLVTEEFAFDEVARDRGHVDGDERSFLALAVIVQGARDQFLAGAGFAGDHHREIGLHEARERAIDFLHGGRTPHQRHALDLVMRIAFGAGTRRVQRAADDGDQLLQVEGLRQVVVSAALGRLDRGHERVLRAHHDDRQVGPQLLDARQKLEGVFVGHDDVGDDEVAVARLHPAPQRRGDAGRAHFVAGPRQGLAQHGSNGHVVVSNQYRSAGHQFILQHRFTSRARPERLPPWRGTSA